jgi:NAD(P)-dependent dehydrogenase (short-subunit alcohol dehydrogenase family)
VTGLVDGKVAIVTGAASGMGRASALAFAREGAAVVVSDVNATGGEETVASIVTAGGTAAFVSCDVSKALDVERLVEETLERFGRLDCAHNNAGVLQREQGRLPDLSEEDFDRVIGVNLKGVWLCMKYEIPAMLRSGGGAIVNTATRWQGGAPGAAFYSASKHGIAGLSWTAALEFAKEGVRVNELCPGPTETPMLDAIPDVKERVIREQPTGRLGLPSELAEAVVWLCSDRASFVSGAKIAVDGASTSR